MRSSLDAQRLLVAEPLPGLKREKKVERFEGVFVGVRRFEHGEQRCAKAHRHHRLLLPDEGRLVAHEPGGAPKGGDELVDAPPPLHERGEIGRKNP